MRGHPDGAGRSIGFGRLHLRSPLRDVWFADAADVRCPPKDDNCLEFRECPTFPSPLWRLATVTAARPREHDFQGQKQTLCPSGERADIRSPGKIDERRSCDPCSSTKA